MKENGIRKQDVLLLMKRMSIDSIEKSLVKLFMVKNELKTTNILVDDFVKNVSDDMLEGIKQYFQNKDIEITLKNVERIFELLVDPVDRKLNGVFYTPNFIVDYIVNKTIYESTETICDPSCGSGAFLVEATKRLSLLKRKPIIKVIEGNIYGRDISQRSVKRCKIILTLLALENGEDKKEIAFNIEAGDSLKAEWSRRFDAIIGNPPYVRIQNLPSNIRDDIQKKWFTARSGNIDLFLPFIELGLKILSDDGKMGYIIPNTYFTSMSAKKLREYLQGNRFVSEIFDFNHLQLFADATTYTCITLFDKRKKNTFRYNVIHNLSEWKNSERNEIKFSRLSPESWNLLDDTDYSNIKKIETIGIPLGSMAHINIGIATLRNYLYIVDNGKAINGYYTKTYNGKEFLIENGITRDIIKASILKTEKDIEKNKEKIIFPYRKLEGKYKIIPESELKSKFPNTHKYFLAIRSELEERDRGKKKYDTWYAYGRRQSLNNGHNEKLLSPDVSSKPRFILTKEKDLLFYCGYSTAYNGDIELLGKILNSGVFWYYIQKTSRNYSNGYKSFAKHFIAKFSIPQFTKTEIERIKKSDNKIVNNMLVKKYGLSLKLNNV